MRELVNWKDRVVEYPRRFKRTDLGGDLCTLERSPGTVKEEGTPQNATNFNTMDLAAFEAMLMANENQRMIRLMQSTVDGLDGQKIPVELTNTQTYPFNGSQNAVQITPQRNDKNYTVEVEVVSKEGGFIGDFEITEKLVNGFKIAYTGSATKVNVICYVRGGI